MIPVSCYSKCGPETSNNSITWELVRDAESQAVPTSAESESLKPEKPCLRRCHNLGSEPLKLYFSNLLDVQTPQVNQIHAED